MPIFNKPKLSLLTESIKLLAEIRCHSPLILEAKTSDLLYFANEWSNKSKTLKIGCCDILNVVLKLFEILYTRKRQVANQTADAAILQY